MATEDFNTEQSKSQKAVVSKGTTATAASPISTAEKGTVRFHVGSNEPGMEGDGDSAVSGDMPTDKLHLEKDVGGGSRSTPSNIGGIGGTEGDAGSGGSEEAEEEESAVYELSMVVSYVKEPWMEAQGNLVAHIRVGPTYHQRKEVRNWNLELQ